MAVSTAIADVYVSVSSATSCSTAGCRINGTERYLNSQTTIQAGNWYHVIGIYNGSEIKLFVNGEEAASPMSITGNMSASNCPLTIGAYHVFWPSEWFQNYYNGIIDEVNVYSRELLQDDF